MLHRFHVYVKYVGNGLRGWLLSAIALTKDPSKTDSISILQITVVITTCPFSAASTKHFLNRDQPSYSLRASWLDHACEVSK